MNEENQNSDLVLNFPKKELKKMKISLNNSHILDDKLIEKE